MGIESAGAPSLPTALPQIHSLIDSPGTGRRKSTRTSRHRTPLAAQDLPGESENRSDQLCGEASGRHSESSIASTASASTEQQTSSTRSLRAPAPVLWIHRVVLSQNSPGRQGC
mgnify:FL=1